jgi:hypothetical protein
MHLEEYQLYRWKGAGFEGATLFSTSPGAGSGFSGSVGLDSEGPSTYTNQSVGRPVYIFIVRGFYSG